MEKIVLIVTLLLGISNFLSAYSDTKQELDQNQITIQE